MHVIFNPNQVKTWSHLISERLILKHFLLLLHSGNGADIVNTDSPVSSNATAGIRLCSGWGVLS